MILGIAKIEFKKTKLIGILLLTVVSIISMLVYSSISKPSEKEKTAMEKLSHKYTNRLINEKSPYLLQHAHNPVDWHAWGEEAFEKARKENKPIFLSIGYSTCHWCHVMEQESFEDPEVAALMNDVAVSIKVDREERPDLDNLYMMICHMMTGSGGWPLNVFLTPDKKPFFAATYIPKDSRFGRIGMKELFPRVRDMWNLKRDGLLEAAERVTDALNKSQAASVGPELDQSVLDLGYKQLDDNFDNELGGFSTAPKFPTPHNLTFLLRYWKRTGSSKSLAMVEKTLEAMHYGGIYDHLGYGFHRYSTDTRWLVPHFEKMLYDQALLAIAYTEAYQGTKKEMYKKAAEEIFAYVLRDMTDPLGGFYAGEDADSEGVEGKFYVWTEQEIRQALDAKKADVFINVYNVEKDGNFKDEATHEKTGTNILHLNKPLSDSAKELNMSEEELTVLLRDARDTLFSIREKRVHPHKDDKILVDWNGLMIAALARGARTFNNPRYSEAAAKAVDFILGKVATSEGRLLHRYREGEAAIYAHVDDYAFFIWGLIELYEAAFNASYLETALRLNDDMIEHYWDEEGGGFYFTADDGEKLLVRQKEIYDSALPSGNSVAMANLLRLARIAGRQDLETKAVSIGKTFSERISQAPFANTQLLAALDFGIGPAYEVIIVGNSESEDTKNMIKAVNNVFVPNKVIILKPTEEKSPKIISLADYAKHYTSIDSKATAYVCLNYSCKQPTTDADKMVKMLEEVETAKTK